MEHRDGTNVIFYLFGGAEGFCDNEHDSTAVGKAEKMRQSRNDATN